MIHSHTKGTWVENRRANTRLLSSLTRTVVLTGNSEIRIVEVIIKRPGMTRELDHKFHFVCHRDDSLNFFKLDWRIGHVFFWFSTFVLLIVCWLSWSQCFSQKSDIWKALTIEGRNNTGGWKEEKKHSICWGCHKFLHVLGRTPEVLGKQLNESDSDLKKICRIWTEVWWMTKWRAGYVSANLVWKLSTNFLLDTKSIAEQGMWHTAAYWYLQFISI